MNVKYFQNEPLLTLQMLETFINHAAYSKNQYNVVIGILNFIGWCMGGSYIISANFSVCVCMCVSVYQQTPPKRLGQSVRN